MAGVDSLASPVSAPPTAPPLPACPYDKAHVVASWLASDGTQLEISAYAPANEAQLPALMALVAPALSEPYSIFTYRYFLDSWPHLCFLAHAVSASGGAPRLVGAVVSKEGAPEEPNLSEGGEVRRQGYVAMLVVDPAHRKQGVGLRLAELTIRAMRATCDEVMIETEVTNVGALRLYEGLGFIRTKRLPKYYLNANDAFQLKSACAATTAATTTQRGLEAGGDRGRWRVGAGCAGNGGWAARVCHFRCAFASRLTLRAQSGHDGRGFSGSVE